MEGPPLGPGGEDITWPDQVAPRGRKASSTRKIKPQTSNPKPQKWKRVMIAGGSINLFKDGSNRVPGSVGSYVEVFVAFWHMQCGGFAEGRLQVMEGFLELIGPLDTQLWTCLAGISPYFQ